MQNRIGLWLTGVAVCFVPAVVAGLLTTPGTAQAKKPGGGGGKTEDVAVCVQFEDAAGHAIGSDWLLSGSNMYYHNPRKKVEALIVGSTGRFNFDTNTSNKPHAGRTAWVDFSNPVDDDGDGVPDDPDHSPPSSLVGGGWPESVTMHTEANLLTMAPFDSQTTALEIQLLLSAAADGEAQYMVWYGQKPFGTPLPDPTAEVTVTAGADIDGDGSPDSWTIEAAHDPDPGSDNDRAILLAFDYSVAEGLRGRFHLPFKITITKM